MFDLGVFIASIRKWFPWLVVLLVIGGLLALTRNQPTKVQVVQARTQDLTEVLALSGRVRGVQESLLAPEVSGTIRALLVQEGATVKKGQTLAELDSNRLRAQKAQALDRVRVAQAQLEIAMRGPLPSQIEEVRAQTEAQRLAAAASLESARQKLLEAQRGPRSEQIEQTQAAVREALAESEQKEREARRLKNLYGDDAVSKQALEQAQTLAKSSLEKVRNAEARLRELENGTRPEQLEQARQAVTAAQADLSSAREAGSAKLQQLLDLPRPEDVALAQAQLEEARSALRVAQEQLALSNVLAPYDGVVGRRLSRVGDQASPNQPIFTFSSQPALEIRVDVDESDRARLALGQKARIRANGFDDDFEAQVKELAPEVDSIRGTMEARLIPVKAPEWLVPGQTVDVNLILGEQAPRLVLPLTCVLLRGEKSEVIVVENGRARFRQVTLSSPTQAGYLIRTGISDKDRVVLYPQGLEDGQKVRAENGS